MDMMERVFEAIRREREYQNVLWVDFLHRSSAKEHSVTEWLLFIDDYLQEAKHAICRKASPIGVSEALHVVRKIAALCVVCMEQNGIEERDMDDLNKSCELHSIKCKKVIPRNEDNSRNTIKSLEK